MSGGKHSITYWVVVAGLIALLMLAINASDRSECRQLYARARTHRDSLNVDDTHMSWRRPSCAKLLKR